MSSAICQNFVQNAWKKELCSNCFKSKDEHVDRPKPKPIALISSKNVESIIKNSDKLRPKRSVRFTKDLTQIIGFGGEDWDSDEDNPENDYDTSDEDFVIESEDEEHEKELKRITKENTDFNTVSLKEDVKKVSTQLLLGKPLVDSSGRKQTLLVSITPFGEDPPSSHKKFNSISRNNKEAITETKSNVILTSYVKSDSDKANKEEKSLLDEITETLENCKNPIQIMSRKKTQKEIVLTVAKNSSNKENLDQNDDKKCDEIIKPNIKVSGDEKNCDENKKWDRKVGLSRTPALKRDQEKPVIYQTSTAKIELLNNTKNFKLSNDVGPHKLNTKDTKVETKSEEEDLKTDHPIGATPDKVDNKKQTKVDATTKLCAPIPERKIDESPAKILDLPPIISKSQMIPQSREQAGEPDGRADPDSITEPPALPLTPPPPLEHQNSFLHNPAPPIYDKPKVPSKPATVLIRKPPMVSNQHLEKTQVLTTFSSEPKTIEGAKNQLAKQDSNGSDIASRAVNKRRAPKPPADGYFRNSYDLAKPEIKDKRERASSCSPKIRDVKDNPQEDPCHLPEPAPRKALSISIDNLETHCGDEKRKEKTKGRFSLKKFLRMGSSKDLPKAVAAPGPIKLEENVDNPLLPRPRLVIVHPSELNGAKVEVVANPKDVVDYQNVSFAQYPDSNDYERYNVGKAAKPPPPPRNLDGYNRNQRPATLSRLPKSTQVLDKQKECFNNTLNFKKTETIYANIGEVRSAIVPNKPQRTASMREREAQQLKEGHKSNSVGNYESISAGNGRENVYDYIASGRSSSPESESSPNRNSPTSKTARLNKRSESSIDVSGEYFKYSNIPRSMSLTYCGSETESEIYSPYSFYGSESEVAEDDHDWTQNGRTHKLRSRKGRSIVHKNLEDNYGAVVAANHEALAQVLENIQQTNHIQPALRGLKSSPNLRWTDFSIKSTSQPLIVGCRTFHQALWGTQCVTLAIYVGAVPSSTLCLGTFNLIPVTEFSDLVPTEYMHIGTDCERDGQVQATVSVFPWLQVNTIQSYSDSLKTKATSEDSWKDATFVTLQLVNALKVLQAQGIEELSLSLNSFILCKEMDKEVHQKLYVLQGLGEEATTKSSSEKYGTLCQCADKVLSVLQLTAKITPLLHNLLSNERAVTLTQVKSILEFCLWGPSDVILGSTIHERELALQRWLDLQRATVLHGLVCARVQLTVYEECHLFFLVRSNSRMMCDASLLLESSNMKHVLSNRCK